jgi:hypothetical protein
MSNKELHAARDRQSAAWDAWILASGKAEEAKKSDNQTWSLATYWWAVYLASKTYAEAVEKASDVYSAANQGKDE